MFAFFNDLHINLNVAIEKRKSFDATDREIIFVQNIDFFDVAIDKNFDKNSEKVVDDSTTNFDDVKNDETKKIKDKTTNSTDCRANCFDFFACRLRICS